MSPAGVTTLNYCMHVFYDLFTAVSPQDLLGSSLVPINRMDLTLEATLTPFQSSTNLETSSKLLSNLFVCM